MNEVLVYGVLILCDKYRLLAQATAHSRSVIAEESGPLCLSDCVRRILAYWSGMRP